ncbi:MAG: hypothetical protein AB1801_23890 [Chloroflexota bacterium]
MNISSAKRPLTSTEVNAEPAGQALVQQLAQQVVAAGLGILGGSTGVALAIAMAIVIQLSLPPTIKLPANIISITVAATLFGVGVSWLMNGLVRQLRPSLVHHSTDRGVQIVLIFSVLTSLLQGILFTQGL